MELFQGRAGRKVRIIDSLRSHWAELAEALGFTQYTIDSLKNSHFDNREACQTMLSLWLDGSEGRGGPITWTAFIEGLTDAGLMDLVDELSDIFDL